MTNDLAPIDWDEWRAAYPTSSWADQTKFYERVWALHPEQNHFTPELVIQFFKDLPMRHRVLEIGGWRGDLAKVVIDAAPEERIMSWTNLEVCVPAIQHSVAPTPYRAQHPKNFPWLLPRKMLAPYDTLVLSHVIEHMLLTEIDQLLDQLPNVRRAYVEAPLDQSGQDWTGYGGSHILREGWDEVLRLFSEHGFEPYFESGNVRFFMRR